MSKKKKKPTSSPQKAPAKNSRSAAAQAKPASSRGQRMADGSMRAARYLWATVTALVIGALLFEPTMVWMLGVGVFMVANAEFMGLWLIVCGYGLACVPAAFGLLIATGRFWFSITQSLWIGLLYGAAGFVFLDRIITFLT
ncbi:hypothetical protein HGQ17_10835 [Nesterenkonia sp. MY13]|uniref:Uncharacterized protein n=1 Tax=Nesterenkonia sedimenti TaxID=1463632 RepID=A0A7X8TKH0_9MICC|nr:hypothetical protein [Nesterenkonia sedimenti]NLS10475.1 hypothetical protein [Nesterenkonia sedimenti]